MPVEKLTNCAFVGGDGTLHITTQKVFSYPVAICGDLRLEQPF